MAASVKTPVWKGPRSLVESPGYPRYIGSTSGHEVRRRYEGDYELVKAEVESGRIVVGGTMSDLRGAFGQVTIRTHEHYRDVGGVGVLMVTLNDFGSGSSASSTIDQPTYEVEWVQLEKPIEQHDKYKNIDAAELRKVKAAIAEDQDYTGTVADAQKLYAKLLRGQDTYLVFSPVVRATTPRSNQPTGSSAGARDNPPISVSGSWEWLKTADRSVSPGQTSDWDQIEEWTGADEWDADIYT